MKDENNISEKSIAELIGLFEDDIVFGRGHIDTRIERSEAREELIKRGKSSMTDIAAHLKDFKHDPNGEVAYAWRSLLEEMRTVHGLRGEPRHYLVLDSWVEWMPPLP